MTIEEQGLQQLIRWIAGALVGKVAVEDGKGLSTNDFADAYRQILDGSYSGEKPGLVPDGTDVSRDAYLRSDGAWMLPPDTQGDWDEENSESPAYIANKPGASALWVGSPGAPATHAGNWW